MRLTLLVLASLISITSFSQNNDLETEGSGGAIMKLNLPFTAITAGGVKGSVEIKTGEAVSWELGGDITPPGYYQETFSINSGVRYYFDKDAFKGYYIAPFLRYRAYQDPEVRINGGYIGLKSGKQWLLGKKKRFVIDTSVGIRYALIYDKNWTENPVIEDDTDQFFFDLSNYAYDFYMGGFRPEARLAIGWKF